MTHMKQEPPRLTEMEAVLVRFLDGEFSSTQLQRLFWICLAPPEHVSNRDPAAQLWHGVVTNLAFYHHCDFERPVLETSLRRLMDAVRTTGRGTLTPITASRCFIDAVVARTIPAPLDPRDFLASGPAPCAGDGCRDQNEGKPGGAV